MAENDLETLKVIRDKEESVDGEIVDFEREQKRIYDETRRQGTEKIQKKRAELESTYGKKMEELKRELEMKRLEIIEQGESRATTIRLDISDKEIEKIVLSALNKYLEG